MVLPHQWSSNHPDSAVVQCWRSQVQSLRPQVEALPGARSKILEMVDVFRGQVVHVGPTTMMIEVSGKQSKIDAFIDVMRPLGIVEVVRSGIIAMSRESAEHDKSELPS